MNLTSWKTQPDWAESDVPNIKRGGKVTHQPRGPILIFRNLSEGVLRWVIMKGQVPEHWDSIVQISVYRNIWKATMWQYKSVNVIVMEIVSQNSTGCGSDMVADINDTDEHLQREMARNGQYYKLLCTVSKI